MTKTLLFLVVLMLSLGGCAGTVTRGSDARILAMGDSLMAWHGISNRSIPAVVGAELGEEVADRSVAGAHMIYNLPLTGAMGMKIAKQYAPGKWDWVLLNGGGNDLWLGCGCVLCTRKLNRLAAADGSGGGEIPALIRKLRAGGAKVVYIGYLRSPGLSSPIEHCRDEADELDRRISRFAAGDPDVHFVSLASLVPDGDRSYHAFDMIHPSVKASRIIGARVAEIIEAGRAGAAQ